MVPEVRESFARATFRFMDQVNFPLHTACEGFDASEPPCPFVNLSAHFLSCVMIESSLARCVQALEAFADVLKDVRDVHRRMNSKMNSDKQVQFDTEVRLSEGRSITVELIADRFTSSALKAQEELESQHLLRTNTDICEKPVTRESLLNDMEDLVKAALALGQLTDDDLTKALSGLCQRAVDFIPILEIVQRNIAHFAEDKKDLARMIVDHGKTHLSGRTWGQFDANGLVRKLCGSVRYMAQEAGIWGSLHMRTLCEPGSCMSSSCTQGVEKQHHRCHS